MSGTIAKVLPYAVDLEKPIKKTYLDTIFATEDNQAHRFDITLKRNGAAVTPDSGTSVSAYFIRYADNATVPLTGSVSGSVVSVTLSKACYTKAGQFALIIKAATVSTVSTVLYAEGTIYTSRTDTIVDQEHIIPSLSDLLAQIDDMEAATEAANTATQSANTATGKANTAASAIDGMTVSATSGTSADASISERNGAKHIAFTLPKGDPGNTPYIGSNGNWFVGSEDTGTKAQGPAGQNGTGAGTVTAVNVGSTTHEPDATGVVNLGDLSIYAPVRGTDYWTEADIAEIRSYVDDAILGGAW